MTNTAAFTSTDPIDPSAEPPRVHWGYVALFYAIALGIATAIALVVFFALGGSIYGSAIAQLSVAFLYMPAPLVAGLVVEAIRKKGFLITHVFQGLKPRLWRVFLVGMGWWAFLLVVMLGGALLLGNVAHIPGMGILPTSQAQFLRTVQTTLPPGVRLTPSQLAQMPPFWTIYLEVVFAGIVAGFTVNALFAFGEEYGWRGVLQDLLAPLSSFKANIVIGVMWGLWHAPIIILTGYNYPGQPWLGSLTMAIVLIPFAAVEYQARRLTGSLFGPAVVHGMYNAFAGIFLFAAGRNALIGFPLGIAAFFVFALAAWIMASLPVDPLPLPGSTAYSQDRPQLVAGIPTVTTSSGPGRTDD